MWRRNGQSLRVHFTVCEKGLGSKKVEIGKGREGGRNEWWSKEANDIEEGGIWPFITKQI